tara:strand:+ start:1827 stop:3689 length:1863 start_codon:yes stop_codon:yes gene_type:complete
MLKKIRNGVNILLPSPLGPFGKLLIVIMTVQLLFVHFSGVHYFRIIPRDMWRIFHSYILILSGLLLVKYPLENYKWASFSLQSLFVLIQCAFIGYFVKTEQSFDYAVVADNFNEIFYSESLFVILNGIDPTAFYIGIIGIVIILFKTLKRPTLKKEVSFSLKKYSGVFSIYLLFAFTPIIQFDELTNFFRSATAFYFQSPKNKFEISIREDSFPFLTQTLEQKKPLQEKPHIFLIMVESFNAGFVNQKDEDGNIYTPYFNSMIKKGVYIDRFYGTSVQTVKGHFSTLFSLLPLIKGKVYKDYEHNNFKSLPMCLKDVGYNTFFFNGHNSTGFDNTRSMMLTHGFDTYLIGKELMDESFKESWGSWGLSDDELYRQVFNYLEKDNKGNSPKFITITPSYHHVPFSVPREKRELYESPFSLKSRYANSIRLVDNGFKVFFDELKKRPEFRNSLIIITADHAFPVGNHNIYFNEIGYYEESFRIPCLILWENHLIPRVDKNHIFSQLDIAPTILENINALPEFHHFQGQDMLGGSSEKKPVFLIQPYNGTILCSIDFPFKYLKRLRTDEEWLFNLDEDPLENKNLIDLPGNNALLDELRKSLKYCFLNQYLIENNQIIPTDNL